MEQENRIARYVNTHIMPIVGKSVVFNLAVGLGALRTDEP